MRTLLKKSLFIALVVGLSSSMGFGASLKGTVTLGKKAPKAKKVKMSADPACVKASNGKTVYSERVVVNDGKLKNVFVWIKKGIKKGTGKKLTNQVVLDQAACMYDPHVQGVMVGQPLLIKNSDPFLHNVHSMAKKNKPAFNIGMAVAGQTKEVTFKKQEVMIKVKCDVHGWMTTYIGVVGHPFFAVTDANGNYEIKDLPAGDYTVEFWHEKYKRKTENIKVAASGATLDFKF